MTQEQKDQLDTAIYLARAAKIKRKQSWDGREKAIEAFETADRELFEALRSLNHLTDSLSDPITL